MDEEKERPRYYPPLAKLQGKQKETPKESRRDPTRQVKSYINACPVRSRGRNSRPTSNGVKVRFSLCRKGIGREERGVFFAELSSEVGRNLDAFDLICHVAWGRKPLTRGERVEIARKKDYFAKYEGKAREVIDALLAKYADQGITAIDDIGDLQVSPFDQFGTPYQIVNDIFGGREKYLTAVKEVQTALYAS